MKDFLIDRCLGKCKLMPDVADNIIDHLPVSISIVLSLQSDDASNNEHDVCYYFFNLFQN